MLRSIAGEFRGVNVKFLFPNPEKRTSLRGTASFDVLCHLCVKICSRAWAVGRWKNPDKKEAE